MLCSDQLHPCAQIDVSFNSFNQAASLELIAAMKGNSMVSIGMMSCELGVEGAQAMAELVSVTPSLTTMLIGDNSLGDDGTTILCNALGESKVSVVQKLDLRGNGIGPDGANAIAALCTVTSSITSVWSPAHQPAPVCALNVPSSLLISYSCLSLDPSCAQLDLSGNVLGSEGAKVLAPAIAVCASLTSVR
jgi:Ran GTPase-activating protein (RanGAP) involved in mRNA processing and transport